MAISPVEMISMAPKSQEASMMRQNEVQKPSIEQQMISAKLHSEIKHNSEQTVPTNKSMNPEFRYDAKEESKNSYKAVIKKRKKKSKDKEKKRKGSSFGGIDIRI